MAEENKETFNWYENRDKDRAALRTLSKLVNEGYQLMGWAVDLLPPEYQTELIKWMDRYAKEVASADSEVAKVLDEIEEK